MTLEDPPAAAATIDMLHAKNCASARRHWLTAEVDKAEILESGRTIASSGGGPMTYKAFLSYSHAADGKLAPALESALEQLARPFYRPRALRVFRDETSLHLTPELWPTIRKALEESEHFILMASPAAAQSKWVRDEVDEWLRISNGSVKNVHIVLTEGEIAWDREAGSLKTNALPPALAAAFKTELKYLDFRWARDHDQLSLRNPRFLEDVGKLAAPLHGMDLDELIGEDVRQHRRFKLVAVTAIALLLILSIAASGAAYYANSQRKEADVQRIQAMRSANLERIARQRAEAAQKAERDAKLLAQQREREANEARDFAQQQRKFAEEQRKEAEKQTRIAEEQRRQAVDRGLKLQAALSDTQYRAGSQLIDDGDTATGVAYLTEALKTDPRNRSAADRLYSLIAQGNQPLLIDQLIPGEKPPESFAVSPDGQWIAAVFDGPETVDVVLSHGGEDCRVPTAGLYPHSVHFAGNDSLIITVPPPGFETEDGSGAVLVGSTKGQPTVVHALPSPARLYAIDSTADQLAIACTNGKIVHTHLHSPASVEELPDGNVGNVMAMSFGEDDGQLTIVGTKGAVTYDLSTRTSKEVAIVTGADLADVSRSGAICVATNEPATPETRALTTVTCSGAAMEGWRRRFESAETIALDLSDAGDFVVVTLDVGEAHLLTKAGDDTPLRHDGVVGAFVDSDDSIIYTISDFGSVKPWNALTGAPLGAPLEHLDSYIAASGPRGFDFLMVKPMFGAAYVWDVRRSGWRAERVEHAIPQSSESNMRGGRFVLRRVDNGPNAAKVVWSVWDVTSSEEFGKIEDQWPDFDNTMEDFVGSIAPFKQSGVVPSAAAAINERGTVAITAVANSIAHVTWLAPHPPVKSDGDAAEHDPLSFVDRIVINPEGDKALITYHVRHKAFRPAYRYEIFSLLENKSLIDKRLRPDQVLLAVSRDLDKIIVRESSAVVVRDAYDFHPLGKPARHVDIASAQFLDERMFATVSREGTLRVWEIATGFPLSEALVFDPNPPRLTGPLKDDAYFAMLKQTRVSSTGTTISLFDPRSDMQQTWPLPPPLDRDDAKRLAEIASVLYGSELKPNGGVELSTPPTLATLREQFAADIRRGGALADVISRALKRP